MAIDEEIILFRWHLLQYQEADERFMDYRELLKESNEEVKERFELASERIRDIADGEDSKMSEPLSLYFKTTASFLSLCAE